MSPDAINCIILDRDGVLRNEDAGIPGMTELYLAMQEKKIRNVLLSNNSRETSGKHLEMLRQGGVPDVVPEQAMTSAEATAEWMVANPSTDRVQDMRVFAVGEDGLVTSLADKKIVLANDQWDGKKWGALPTDVVVGFDTKMDYKTKMAPAWNAIRQGARWVHTNGDISYRNAAKLELPANGAALAYLASTGKRPAAVIGKPETGMAEMALRRLGVGKEDARIAVIGDNRTEDVGLAENLKKAGWKAEAWVVLTGVLQREECTGDPAIDRVFEDIRDVTRSLLAARGS